MTDNSFTIKKSTFITQEGTCLTAIDMRMKERTFGKQVDINGLTQTFARYLQNDGWKVQQSADGQSAVVQAQKAGILRDIIAADRALTFKFANQPDGLHVSTGIGKWVQNIGVMAVEALLLSELFLVVDVPEMLWTEHIEKKIMAQLAEMVNTN